MSSDLIRALEGLHDLVLVLDAKGTCRHAGPHPLPPGLFRSDTDSSEGLSLGELLTPDLRGLLQSIASEMEPGHSRHFSYELGGSAGHYELEAVRSESGELTVLGCQRAERVEQDPALDQAVLQQVMETGVAGICVLDLSGAIVYANQSAEDILGLSRAEIETRRYDSPQWNSTTVDSQPMADEDQPFVRVLTTKRPIHDVRHAIEWPDGSRKILSINGAPVLNESGEVERLVFAVLDITKAAAEDEARERMNREMESLARLESLSVLAGGVAHDFNNILVGMLGGIEMVREQLGPSHPASGAIELMEQSARRASELTHQLLAFSGKSRFVVGPRDLSELVRETSRLLESLVSKDTHLILALARDLPLVDIDSTQVSQLIMNMVINASQAQRADGGEVSIVTRFAQIDADYLKRSVQHAETAEPGDFVILEICDDGVGMTPDVAARVFDPFFTTKPEGHGLGLAAVMGVIRSHGGFVGLQTKPGTGTRFSLGFPVAEPVAPAPEPTPLKSGACFQGTVLVIDDEEFVRTITSRVLEHEGCEVLTAEDGVAGLALYERHQSEIGAVVLDLTMPRMPGEQVLAELRRLAPQLPVIVTSGYTDEGPFAADPATRFLSKPFGRKALLEALASF
jgi:PAS domain S-box-containing protein